MFDTRQVEVKQPQPERRRLGVALAVLVVLAAVITVPLLLRDDGGSAAEITTATVAGVAVELLPWGEDPSGVHVQVTVPPGWTRSSGYVRKSGDLSLLASAVENVYGDRCQWTGTLLDPPVGPGVNDLATAFATIWRAGATSPTDVVLGGYTGKQMDLTVPADANFGDCDAGRYMVWSHPGNGRLEDNRWAQWPGQVLRLWILDVEGRRIVIEATHSPSASASGQAELQQVVGSIAIEP